MNTYAITTKYLAFLLLTVASLTACKKEPNQKDPTPTIRPRLTKLEQDDNNFMIFGYTTDGYLNKFKVVNEYLTSEAHIGYNDAKKPIAGTLDGYDLEFLYEGTRLIKIVFTPAVTNQQIPEQYREFTYVNGRVSQTIDYIKQGTNYRPGAKHVYEYYANGDVKSDTHYYLVALPEEFEQIERTVYEYDDQINALQIADEVAYALLINKSAHNIKKTLTYDASDELEETRSYSLNYNSFGLPTTGVENITYPNSPGVNRTLTYSYQ